MTFRVIHEEHHNTELADITADLCVEVMGKGRVHLSFHYSGYTDPLTHSGNITPTHIDLSPCDCDGRCLRPAPDWMETAATRYFAEQPGQTKKLVRDWSDADWTHWSWQ